MKPSRAALCSARNPAFTLIELLVVIAVIALIAGILFPVFAQARGRGRQAHCLSNIHQLVKAAWMYKDDYDGYYPQLHLTPDPPPNQPFQIRYWHILLYPYTKSWQVFRCPSCDADAKFNGPGLSRLAEGGAVLHVCEVYIPPEFPGSNAAELRAKYSGTYIAPVNESYEGTGGYGWNVCGTRLAGQSINDATFVSPATTLMIGESTKQMNGAGLYPPDSDRAYRAKHNIQDGCGWEERFYGPVPPLGRPYAWQMSSRHSDGANVSFFDGHSKWVRREWLEAHPEIFHPDSTIAP